MGGNGCSGVSGSSGCAAGSRALSKPGHEKYALARVAGQNCRDSAVAAGYSANYSWRLEDREDVQARMAFLVSEGLRRYEGVLLTLAQKQAILDDIARNSRSEANRIRAIESSLKVQGMALQIDKMGGGEGEVDERPAVVTMAEFLSGAPTARIEDVGALPGPDVIDVDGDSVVDEG